MAIMCACVPSLKPLVNRFAPRLLRNPEKHAQSHSSPETSPEGSIDEGSIRQSRRNRNGEHELLEVLTRGQVQREVQEATADIDAVQGNFASKPFLNLLNIKPPNMLRLSNKESVPPIALVTFIYSLWGFSFGILNSINARFREHLKLNTWSTYGLHAAYWGGYLIFPLLVGRPVLKKLGIAATVIAGLYMYACGALLFWPAAVSSSFPTMIVSNLIVGSGFGVLDTVANMFVAICGPLKYSEIRLCLSKGTGDIAIIIAGVLEIRVLGHSTTEYLVSVQWSALVIPFFNVILAVIFYYLPVPEAPDEELDELAHHQQHDVRLYGIPVIWLTLGLGVWSQFFYGGALETMHLDMPLFTKGHKRQANTSIPASVVY
ncbi:hypothetical protein EIK77_007489 [Talaromyces pinophilus]|nr:hypothetical protein EIK77_007489 [Talaromyces pinophilus]